MDAIIPTITDSLPDWLTLVLASGIVIASVVLRVKSANGPITHIVESLRAGIVTEQRISKIIGDLLHSWSPNTKLIDWATSVIVSLYTKVPDFFSIPEEQQASAVASIFSKLPEAKASELLGGAIPKDVVKVQFARKKIFAALWSNIVAHVKSELKLGG